MIVVQQSKMAAFSGVDYALFGTFLCISISIGLYHSKKRRGGKESSGDDSGETTEYLMGGRNMPIVPICLSLLTTFMSGISLLGAPGEVYQRGFLMWVMYMFGGLSLLINGKFFLPVFYKLKATSAFEYLEKRYDSVFLRRVGAAIFMVNTLIYMAIVMYAPALALAAVTAVSLYPFIFTVGLACTIYTSIGGLKAVVWTDTLQAFFMYLGLTILLVKGTSDAGGLGRVLDLAQTTGRVDAVWKFNPTPAQYNSLWIAAFGSISWYLILFCINPMALQRFCSMPSLKHAKTVNYLTLPALMVLGCMCCYIGIAMLAYYSECDPIKSGKLYSKDQIAILFAIDVLGFLPGLPGIFLACVFSGTLSTISSGINSMTAVLWEDFLKGNCARRLNDRQTTLLAKISATVFGLMATGLAVLCQHMEGLVQASYSTTGALTGPLYGLFVLGVFVPSANKYGAIIALTVSTAFLSTCSLGNNLYKPYAAYVLPTNSTCIANDSNVDLTGQLQSAANLHYGDITVNFLYRISSFSYAALGLFLVLLIGWTTSGIRSTNSLNAHKRQLAHALTYSGRRTPLPIIQNNVMKADEAQMTDK